MPRGNYADAKRDFDAALAIAPMIGEAYVDRGAALVGLRSFSEAIADIDHGLISVSSPIARALISKTSGDVASVQAPGGASSYGPSKCRR